jgi:hypothetical protein
MDNKEEYVALNVDNNADVEVDTRPTSNHDNATGNSAEEGY